MDGIYLPDHGQEAHDHESESFSVGVFFLSFLTWHGYATIRYGMGTVWLWVWLWYMVLALGRTKDIRHGTRMEYIYHEEGGGGRGEGGRMLQVYTCLLVFKKAF